MSSFAQSGAAITGTVTMAAGRNVNGSTTLSISVANAALQLIVSASGTATLTITGAGSLAGALSASGSATITFAASPPLLGALAGLTATAGATLSQSAVLTAIGRLAGDILPYTALSPESLAAAVRDVVIDGQYTMAEVLRLVVAATAGKSTGGPGSPAFRDLSDTKDRIAGTADSSGNRSGITYNVSP